eukprot:3656319-Rhodomonas_salina.2
MSCMRRMKQEKTTAGATVNSSPRTSSRVGFGRLRMRYCQQREKDQGYDALALAAATIIMVGAVGATQTWRLPAREFCSGQ